MKSSMVSKYTRLNLSNNSDLSFGKKGENCDTSNNYDQTTINDYPNDKYSINFDESENNLFLHSMKYTDENDKIDRCNKDTTPYCSKNINNNSNSGESLKLSMQSEKLARKFEEFAKNNKKFAMEYSINRIANSYSSSNLPLHRKSKPYHDHLSSRLSQSDQTQFKKEKFEYNVKDSPINISTKINYIENKATNNICIGASNSPSETGNKNKAVKFVSNKNRIHEIDSNIKSNNLVLTPLRTDNSDAAIKHCMHAFNYSLKDFDVGAVLGDGAHGTVFMARERRTGYICVLKCIAKAHLIRCNQEPMLKKEIELQAHLKHPHIACMFTWFATSSAIFLAMEYCYNGDLFGYLDKHGPFSEERVSRMLFEITWALRSCHDKRIAHLDLKPENILVTHNELCKLADFGLSAHIGSKHGPVSVTRGTHDYWSPEQCARGSRVGPVANTTFGNFDYKTDIWTLGILAFELRFGFPPFGSTNENGGGPEAQNILMTQIQKSPWNKRLLSDIPNARMSDEFSNFIDICLNKNPDNRPTAEELLENEFIVKHNNNRMNSPMFLNQPRPPNKGFNNKFGPYLTPISAVNISF